MYNPIGKVFRTCPAGTEGGSTVPFHNSFAYKNGCPSVLKRSETVTLYGGTERNRSNRTGSYTLPTPEYYEQLEALH